jgi:hypothetical protein
MTNETQAPVPSRGGLTLLLAWLAVGVPLLWGVAQTIKKASALLH